MGYIRHHAIVVTSSSKRDSEAAYAIAQDLFQDDQLTEILEATLNGYYTFFVGPDGSKEGWAESKGGDDRRREFIQRLEKFRYDDGSIGVKWCEFSYGEDESAPPEILSWADHPQFRQHSEERREELRAETPIPPAKDAQVWFDLVLKFVGDNAEPSARRTQFIQALRDLFEHTDYFEAPASTKYHLSRRHGLVEHSLNVAKYALTLAHLEHNRTGQPVFDQLDVIIAGLWHDLGKIGFYDPRTKQHIPRYVAYDYLRVSLSPTEDTQQCQYVYNKQMPAFSLGYLGAMTATSLMALPPEVLQAIAHNDGMYVPEGKTVAHKLSPLAHLIINADTWVGQVRETLF